MNAARKTSVLAVALLLVSVLVLPSTGDVTLTSTGGVLPSLRVESSSGKAKVFLGDVLLEPSTRCGSVGGVEGAGLIEVYDSSGNPSACPGLSGNGVTIYGGDSTTRAFIAVHGSDIGDFADNFPSKAAAEPGTVLTIAEDGSGKLELATRAYDSRVAGVVSGAGPLRSGVLVGAREGSVPLAVSGRTYCYADATHAPINVGDLLTTSDTPGHAMKANGKEDLPRGCIIGKAMTRLEKGKGLVLVLIQPQ